MPARTPFDRWPEQLVDARFGYAWFTAPSVFLNQLTDRHATITTVHALHDAIDHVLERRREEIDAHGGLTIIHDWRELRSYDSDARKAYLERMKRREPGYLKQAIAIVGNTPLLRMAVQTANILMAMRIGGSLDLSNDADAVLRRCRVASPLPGWR